MGEARRRQKADLSRPGTPRRSAPRVLVLFIAGALVTTALTAQATGLGWPATPPVGGSQAVGEVCAPKHDGVVVAYVGGRQSWKRVPLGEIERGQEFSHDGKLLRVSSAGRVERVQGIRASQLGDTLTPYDRQTHRSPGADDVVRLLNADHSHRAFRLLRNVLPESKICFGNAIYEVALLDGFLQICPTGNVFKRVVRTFRKPARTIVDLVVLGPKGNEQTLHGTPEHPFYVPARMRFVPMGDLTPGTRLHTDGGEAATVASTRHRGFRTTGLPARASRVAGFCADPALRDEHDLDETALRQRAAATLSELQGV